MLVVDIIDVTVFGMISAVVCTYMMSLKCQRFLYARKVSILSETDLLTGFCNRNSYEQKLEAYSSMCNQMLSCVLVTDEKEEVIQAKIDRVQILVEKESYHISIGYSVGNTSETDVSLLISTAEKRMYEAKQLFYQQRGIDRGVRR